MHALALSAQQSSSSVANPGFLRQLSILLLNPLLADVEFHRLMATTCSMLVRLAGAHVYQALPKYVVV